MNLLFCYRDCFCRIIKRKKTLIFLLLLFLCSTLCGIIFVNSPSFYEYHLRMCDRYLDRVCYSQTNVFLIFIKRTAGHSIFLLLLFVAGVHRAACVFTPLALVYRGYTFGGSIYIFLKVYRFSGAVVLFVLYLPVHLLLDVLFLACGTLSFARAADFRFCKNDFKELMLDFFLFLLAVTAICLLEAVLLLAFFHPLGNIL